MSWFDEAGSGHAVPIEDVLSSDVLDLIVAVIDAGALVSVGKTSDGGAVGVTVTLDGRYRREYFRDASDAAPWLDAAREAVADEAARLAASSGTRRRNRRA